MKKQRIRRQEEERSRVLRKKRKEASIRKEEEERSTVLGKKRKEAEYYERRRGKK